MVRDSGLCGSEFDRHFKDTGRDSMPDQTIHLRHSERVRIALPLKLRTEQDESVVRECETVAVNLNGCGLMAGFAVPVGAQIRLEVGNDNISGRVVTCMPLVDGKSFSLGIRLEQPYLWPVPEPPAVWRELAASQRLRPAVTLPSRPVVATAAATTPRPHPNPTPQPLHRDQPVLAREAAKEPALKAAPGVKPQPLTPPAPVPAPLKPQPDTRAAEELLVKLRDAMSGVDRKIAELDAKREALLRLQEECAAKISEGQAALDKIQAEGQGALEGIQAQAQAALNGIQAQSHAALDDIQAQGHAALDNIQAQGQPALDNIQAQAQAALQTLQAEAAAVQDRIAEHAGNIGAEVASAVANLQTSAISLEQQIMEEIGKKSEGLLARYVASFESQARAAVERFAVALHSALPGGAVPRESSPSAPSAGAFDPDEMVLQLDTVPAAAGGKR